MENTFAQGAGWLGTFLIVLAYFLITFKKIDSANKIYPLLNLFGVMGIGINVFFHKAWPAFVMELVWALIAILALIKLSRNRNLI
jgi:hypothetical protein